MCPRNITFLHKILYRIATRSTKSLFLHKNLTRKNIKIFTSSQIWAKCRKNFLHWKKSTLTFNIRQSFFFFLNPNYIKVNSSKHVCLGISYQLPLIKTHWSSFKYNDSLHTLNVYQISRKEDQAGDFWVTDETAASKIRFLALITCVECI